MRKPRTKIFGGDIETDNDENSAWIVQWAISDGKTEYVGRSIDSLRDCLFDMMHEYDSIIYFHNLKYDLTFIKYALFDIHQKENIPLIPIMRDKNPIIISLQPEPESGLYELSLRDSLKKLPGKLSAVAKYVGMQKLPGFDFYPGWSNNIDFDDPQNWQYVRMDARIVAVAMSKLHEDGNVKPTFSGDAWLNAQKSINGLPIRRENDNWSKYFPKLPIEVDTALRAGYSGGLNISRHRGLNKGFITHADVNSMYPAVMYYDELPHGEPIYSKTKPEGSLFVVKAKFKLKLKPGMIPWFTFRRGGEYLIENLKIGEPIVETEFYHTLTLTNVDITTLSEWYDIDIDSSNAEYWSFKSNVGLFRSYIDKYMEMKKKEAAEGRKGKLVYTWSKLMMNGLYGRFGLNTEGENCKLVYDVEINDLTWKRTPANIDVENYLPYSMFITAHARRRLLEYVRKCGPENVIHCDTDSVIHYGGKVGGIEYGNELGQWSIESEPKQIWEGGFKRYVEVVTDEIDSINSLKIAAAGIANQKTDSGLPIGMWIEIWDDPEIICSNKLLGNREYKIKSEWLRRLYIQEGLNPDCVNTMKLVPKSVNGGAILVERQHKLDDCMRIGYRGR